MTWEYQPHSAEETNRLATALLAGSVFTSNHIPPEDDWAHVVRMVFMPIALGGLDQEQITKLSELKAVFYQYLEEAGPRSVNGYPIFYSVKFASQDDWIKAVEKMKQLQAVLEGT